MRQTLIIIALSLFGFNSFSKSETENEEEILQEMVSDSFKGLWYPLSNKTLPYEGFKMKHGKLFRDNQDDDPYTGWYSQIDSNRTVRFLDSFLEGRRQGCFAEWDENGMLRSKGEYFDGQKDGIHIEMNFRGVKISERNYLIGKLHGESNFWYENGQLKLESTFEHGLIMKAKGWLSNGEPCPYTKVIEGKGVIFNFGDGFLEQLLQTPYKFRNLPKQFKPGIDLKLGELKIDK